MKIIIIVAIGLLVVSAFATAQSQQIKYNLASIVVNGDVNATNVVADFFFGDGSGLTGIVAEANLTGINDTIDARIEIKELTVLVNGHAVNSSPVLSNDIFQLIVTPLNLSTSYRFRATENNTVVILDEDRQEHSGVWDIRKRVTTVNNAIFFNISSSSQVDVFEVTVRYR